MRRLKQFAWAWALVLSLLWPPSVVHAANTPTLVDIDSMAHRTVAASQAGSGFTGVYTTSSNAGAFSFDTSVKRLAAHVASLKCVEPGNSATALGRSYTAQLAVFSFYFRIATAPGVNSVFFAPLVTNTVAGGLVMKTDGTIVTQLVNTAASNSDGKNYADSNWHRVDLRAITNSTTWTVDWYIDGVLQTQQTLGGQSISNQTRWVFGTPTSTHNLTFWAQDFVMSTTTGDFPIGAHFCGAVYPNGEGTDSITAGSITNAAGNGTNIYQDVDDWNGGTVDNTTYAEQNATGTSDYAEFTVSTPPSGVAAIWDVHGIIGGFASSTTANATLTVKTQVVDSGGTNIDTIDNAIDYSGSTSLIGYFQKTLARISGGWTLANLASCKVRWGYATIDANRRPRLSAVILEYAGPEASLVAQPRDARRLALIRQ